MLAALRGWGLLLVSSLKNQANSASDRIAQLPPYLHAWQCGELGDSSLTLPAADSQTP